MVGKTVLCVGIVAGCVLAGHAVADGELRRYRTLVKLCNALKMLRIQMVHMMEPLARALGASGTELFEAVAEEIKCVDGVQDAWVRAIGREGKRGGCADCLGKDERNALEQFFGKLGDGDLETQSAAIEACLETLGLLREACRESAARAQRLYLSLGFLTGLAIVVLIL